MVHEAHGAHKIFFPPEKRFFGQQKQAPAASLQPGKIVKNFKIGLKRVAVGAFATFPK